MSDIRYGVRQRHPGRFRCCGVLVDSLTPEGAVQALLTSRHGQPRRTHLCDVYTLSQALSDSGFRDLLNTADINFPVGERLVRLGRRLDARNLTSPIDPVALMLDTMSQGRGAGLRHHLCGSSADIVRALKPVLTGKLPGVDIVATSVLTFPIRPAQTSALLKLTASLRPDIVWVSGETPRQDGFVAEYAARMSTTLVPVGNAFDMLAGVKRPQRPWTARLAGGVRFGYGTMTDTRRSRRLDRAP